LVKTVDGWLNLAGSHLIGGHAIFGGQFGEDSGARSKHSGGC